MGKRLERAKAKGELAGSLAATGAAVGALSGAAPGALIGGTIGAVTGLVVGDQNTVFAIDMVCIPAYQAYMINGTPAMTFYIKAGETLMATGGNVDDVAEGVAEATAASTPVKRKKRKLTAYQRFTKKFNYRAKRKSESSKDYFAARSKALSRAWKKAKRGKK